MAATKNSAEFVLTGGAARYLEVSADTVREWVRLGKLPAKRTATGMLLFVLEDLELFAETRKRRLREQIEAAARRAADTGSAA